MVRLGSVAGGPVMSLNPAWLMQSGTVLCRPTSPSPGRFSLMLFIYRQMNQFWKAGFLFKSVLCCIFYLWVFWARSAEPCSSQGGLLGVRGYKGPVRVGREWGGQCVCEE